MISPNFIIVGFILQLIGGWTYGIDTFRGKIQPNRVSWFLWALAPLIAFTAEVKQGVGLQSLTTLSAGLIPVFVFSASFYNKKAVWRLNWFDFICGGLSLIGLLLWIVTRVGNIAIICSIIADALAGVPTMVKSFRAPQSENYGVYLTGLISSVLTLFTITVWNFAAWGFPVYLIIVNLLLFSLIQFRLGKRKIL